MIYAGLSIVWAEDYNLALSEPLSNISLARITQVSVLASSGSGLSGITLL